jgi:putative ABC transport system substrate-binding protein
MDRRKFIGSIALGLAATPLAALAQQADNPVRIGFLPIGSPSNTYDRSLVEAFRQGLREVGVIENRHVVLDIVWIGNESELPQAVSELLRRGAKLLVPVGTSASVAVKRQVSTIPILFINVGNPVGVGLVESLSRPGGNVTGFSDMHADLRVSMSNSLTNWAIRKRRSTIFGIPNGRTGNTGSRLPSGQPNRLVSSFDHEELATSQKRTMPWRR